MMTVALFPISRRTRAAVSNQDGIATVWSASLSAVICLLLVGLLAVIGVVHTRQYTAHLADEVALVAAQQLPYQIDQACQQAADWVHVHAPRNRLRSCSVKEHQRTHMPAVWVEVEAEYARWTIVEKACAGLVPPR